VTHFALRHLRFKEEQNSLEIASMSYLPSVLANARRAAMRVGARGLIVASLITATAIMLPNAAFAAPVGAVGAPAPVLKAAPGKDPPINFSFNIGGYIGTGNLQSTYVSNGNYWATTGTLTMAANSLGDAGQSYCLIPAASPPGTVTTSPMGAFIYDSLITPGANPGFPDIYALLFSNNSAECAAAGYNGANYSGNDEINIWASDGIPGHYSFYDFAGGVGYVISYVTQAPQIDSFTSNAVGTTTYSYAGNGFSLFQCATSPGVDCAAPGAGNPYKTSNSVTVGMQLGGSLCPGAACGTTSNLLCTANFASMTLNDGLHTINVSNCPAAGSASAWVTSDASGNITAWYVDATGPNNQDIHTLYDPLGAIATACGNCYANTSIGNQEDYGQFGSSPAVYGYNLGAHGSFSPGYSGGTTNAGSCSNGQNCSLVPGNTFTIVGPGAGAIPPGTVLTQQLCVVPADPRGPNCGATNGHKASSLPVASLPQCKGFGTEVIPDNLCGASGTAPGGGQGTGFALILGNAEQLDTFNGTYGHSSLNVEQIPGLQGATYNPGCPKQGHPLLAGQPIAVAAVGTRSNSLVEEQTPESVQANLPPVLDMTSACDPPISNHGPGLTIEGIGFKLRTNDPTVRNQPTDAQNMVTFANAKFSYLDLIMNYTKWTNQTTRKNLQACINKAQNLLNSGSSGYACAAEELYRCDQMVENQGIPYTQFGPTNFPIRLPDPYGDIVRRLGNLYFTINTRINGNVSNNDWPLNADPNLASCPLP
jgi:hypothetical protein